jgi:hypothetical protein
MECNEMTKPQAKPNAAIQAKNDAAINTAFPKAKLREAYDAMAEQVRTENSAKELKFEGGLEACRIASEYSEAARNEPGQPDTSAILQHWKASQKLFVAELAAAGHKFAEYADAAKDKEPAPRLTGYGKNVMSILRGVIEFNIEIADDDTFSSVRKIVEAERADARSDEAKRLAEAKERYREAAKELLNDFGDNVELITEAAEVLENQRMALAERAAAKDKAA